MWGLYFWVYTAVTLSGFLIITMVSAQRLIWQYMERAMSLQKATHIFCFLAAAERVAYILVEVVAVGAPSQSLSSWETFILTSRGNFYFFAAAAFSCIVQYWRRMICFIDDVPSRGLCQDPVFFAVLLSFVFEMVHLVVSFGILTPVMDAVHSFGLAVGSTAITITGVVVARRLYKRVSSWIAGSRVRVFGKILYCAVSLSIITGCFIMITIVQTLYSRFFVVPCLVAWSVTRVLEIVYLGVVLHTSASQQHRLQAHGTYDGEDVQLPEWQGESASEGDNDSFT